MPPFAPAKGAEFNNLYLIADTALIRRIMCHEFGVATDVFFIQGMLNEGLATHNNSLVGFVRDNHASQHAPVSFQIKLCHGLCSQFLFPLHGEDLCDVFFNIGQSLGIFQLCSSMLETKIEKLLTGFCKLLIQSSVVE
ncbi:hypothetical protein ADUPG1_005128, partial [Aduncisulcus paluster]